MNCHCGRTYVLTELGGEDVCGGCWRTETSCVCSQRPPTCVLTGSFIRDSDPDVLAKVMRKMVADRLILVIEYDE